MSSSISTGWESSSKKWFFCATFLTLTEFWTKFLHLSEFWIWIFWFSISKVGCSFSFVLECESRLFKSVFSICLETVKFLLQHLILFLFFFISFSMLTSWCISLLSFLCTFTASFNSRFPAISSGIGIDLSIECKLKSKFVFIFWLTSTSTILWLYGTYDGYIHRNWKSSRWVPGGASLPSSIAAHTWSPGLDPSEAT